MCPKKTTFTRDFVLSAALDVVRKDGWSALSARSIANRLDASVAPVYSAFGSMDSLLRETLKEVRRLLQEYTSRAYTEIPFLNIGVGIISFARDEPMLFRAFFHTGHGFEDLLESVKASTLSGIGTDPLLGRLSTASRKRLLDTIGFYTMGLAADVAAGWVKAVSTDEIIHRLKDIGNIVMFAEVSGIADSDSADSKREWARIMREKKR